MLSIYIYYFKGHFDQNVLFSQKKGLINGKREYLLYEFSIHFTWDSQVTQ